MLCGISEHLGSNPRCTPTKLRTSKIIASLRVSVFFLGDRDGDSVGLRAAVGEDRQRQVWAGTTEGRKASAVLGRSEVRAAGPPRQPQKERMLC